MTQKKQFVNEKGQIEFGVIKESNFDFNYKDFILYDFFDREIKGLRKKLNFHHFNYYCVSFGDYLLAFACVDLGFSKNFFIYFYSYEKGLLKKITKNYLPFSQKLSFPAHPVEHEILYKDKKDVLTIVKSLSRQELNIRGHFGNLDFFFDIPYGKITQPLRVVTPAHHNGWTLTEKCAGISSFKKAYVSFKGTEFDTSKASLIYDWSGGYLKRETNWNWAAFSGHDALQQVIGANLANMVNETGETENAFWVNNQSFKLGMLSFKYQRQDLYQPWVIENKEKTLVLTFTPSHEVGDKKNLILVKNFFRQFMGTFSGSFMGSNKNETTFENIKGIAEIHRALW